MIETIWIVESTYTYDGNRGTAWETRICEEHGFFLTEEACQKKCEALNKGDDTNWAQYVVSKQREQAAQNRKYQQAVREYDILRANGIKKTQPHRPADVWIASRSHWQKEHGGNRHEPFKVEAAV